MDKNTDKKKPKLLIDQIPLALTFDDVLMIPQHSDVDSRFDISLETHFSKNLTLNVPLVSSPMDTVTEDQMAIEMARNGGIGVIHRFQTIEEQARMIDKVKRSGAYVVIEPLLVTRKTTIGEVKELIKIHGINTFLVTDCESKKPNLDNSPNKSMRKNSQLVDFLQGILTNRDIQSSKSNSDLVENVMTTRDKLVTFTTSKSQPIPKVNELLQLMYSNKVEKIPVVTDNNEIQGLCTLKDLHNYENKAIHNVNKNGLLMVAGSVGAKDDYIERARALVLCGVDAIVVDIANGHSKLCIETVETLKDTFKSIDIIAGSIASGEGAEKLIRAGADAIRCGIGNGSICITRIVSGAGVPQLSALLDVAPVCKEYEIPLISDGGNKNSGNMCKALAAGADSIMLGRLVAGCEESPSKIIYKDGKLSKVYRGMAGLGANISKSQKMTGKESVSANFNAEGVEGYIPYAGPLKDVITQFTNGIRSGMSYSGARKISELQERVKFIRITTSGKTESGVHDIKQFS